jgi:hypothetical protein
MTIQEAIIAAVGEYKAGRITAKQLKTAIKFLAVTDRNTFESLKKNYLAGQYDKYLPEELKSQYGLNDADDNALPAVREYNAIKKDYESGKITIGTAQTKLLELGQKYPGAVMSLLKYQPKVEANLTDFINQPYSVARAAVSKGIEFGEKAAAAAGQVYTDVKTGVSTVYDDTIGQMKYIIPIVLIGGGFLAYKLLTSDTAKTVASRV